MFALAAGAAVGLAGSPAAPAARPAAARSPVRVPARAQAADTAKQQALDAERALIAQNAADAARESELRASINALAAKIDKPTIGKGRRAKLQLQGEALSAELAKLDLRTVTARPAVVDESEPNDDAREASTLDASPDRLVVASGSLGKPGDVDLYTFDAPAGARVWAFVDASSSSLSGTGSRDSVLRLIDRDGLTVLAEGDDGATGSNFGRRVESTLGSAVASANVPGSGHFFLEVRAFDPTSTMDSYKLVVVVSTTELQTETTANDSGSSATPLVRVGEFDGIVAGALDQPGDVDVYSLEATSGRPLFAAVDGDPFRTGIATSVSVELLDRDFNTVVKSSASTAASASQTLAIMPPSSGTFYLRVTGTTSSTTGRYTVLGAVGSPRAPSAIPVGPFCGDTAPSVTDQNGSLLQNGIAATCSTTKACPGTSGPNVQYVANAFTNDTGTDQCVTVTATSSCTGNSRADVTAYLGSFVPATPCTNYLGDSGNQIGSGVPITFSVLVPAGQAFVIVVNAHRPGNDCGLFCFTLNSVACTVVCPSNIVVGTGAGNTQCGANVPFTVSTTCGGTATCTANGTPVASGAFFPVGTTTVTCTDGSTMCSFTVTVNDTTPPAVTCPAPTSAAADGNCQAAVPNVLGGVTATDNCVSSGNGVGVTLSQSPTAGTLVPVGTTTITVTASDGTNMSMCTTTFTVTDTSVPSVTCPANITTGAVAGTCAATVNYTVPTATDPCGTPTVVCSPSPGSSFPVGTTTVTCTATDQSNNSSSCTFSVTVNDVTGPQITCPPNVTVSARGNICSAVATYTTPTATDACSAATVACVPASGSTFPQGTTTVTCTATDQAQNTSTCTFTVTVNDTTAPQITCPQNITVQPPLGVCNPTVEYSTPSATDCSATTTVCVPASGSAFPLGITTVTCTATDTSNNSSQCSFTVTVSGPPFSIQCMAPLSFAAVLPAPGSCGLGAVVNYPAPTVTSSACNGNITVSCFPASGTQFPVGTTTVTCTATDQNQLTVSCSFAVTVNGTGGFGVCYVDDYTGDTFREVTDPQSAFYGYWEYHVQATNLTICGIAEYVSYIPGHSFISYDNDASSVWMNANVNLGAGTAVIRVNTFSPYHQYTLRDRNINNDPPCSPQ